MYSGNVFLRNIIIQQFQCIYFLKKDGSISQINGFKNEHNFEKSLKALFID